MSARPSKSPLPWPRRALLRALAASDIGQLRPGAAADFIHLDDSLTLQACLARWPANLLISAFTEPFLSGLPCLMAGQTETLVSTITDWIDLGRLNPGDLVDEAALAAEFGISRTPIREALLQLEAIGLIRRLPRKGATIFRPTLEEFLAILEVHSKLEGLAAGLAARRLSASGAKTLNQIVTACEDHACRGMAMAIRTSYYQLNLRFHETIALAAGNPLPDRDDKDQRPEIAGLLSRALSQRGGHCGLCARTSHPVATDP